MWKVIDSGSKSASELMDFDDKLLNAMKLDDQPIIHFYDFLKPSFTFGVFIKPEELMNPKVYIQDFDFSKRPTGGGVLFHVWDFAFSCLVPKHHEGFCPDVMDSYKYINSNIAEALSEYLVEKGTGFSLLPEEIDSQHPLCKHFCFAKPTKYDLMYGGKKLAGAAQRRKANGYLHQGSISLIMPDFSILDPLFGKNSPVLSAMNLHIHPLLGQTATLTDRKDAREKIKKMITSSFNS